VVVISMFCGHVFIRKINMNEFYIAGVFSMLIMQCWDAFCSPVTGEKEKRKELHKNVC